MRANTITRKVATPFGAMYLHLETNPLGQPIGGSISTPGKAPESQIHKLVECLSEGLDDALKIAAGAQ